MTTDRWMRASDQDRERAAELLSYAYAVGRLNRDELDERAIAAYSARTWGELRDLTADLPATTAGADLSYDIMASRTMPRRAGRPLTGQMAWILVFVLVTGLAGLATPGAIWIAGVLIPLVLIPPALGISRHYRTRAGMQAARRQ